MDLQISKKIIIFYAVLAIFISIIIFSPLCEFKISRLLANLTQQLIVQEVNPVRESYGFSDLKPNEKLNKAAQLKAEDMITRNYFSHTGPEGKTPWVWLDQVNYKYAAAGENLAVDVSDPKVLINAWLASPSHAKNVLNTNFTDIGIGIAKGKINDRKTIVVVMFLAKEKEIPKETPAEKPVVIKKPVSQFVISLLFSIFRRLPKVL